MDNVRIWNGETMAFMKREDAVAAEERGECQVISGVPCWEHETKEEIRERRQAYEHRMMEAQQTKAAPTRKRATRTRKKAGK